MLHRMTPVVSLHVYAEDPRVDAEDPRVDAEEEPWIERYWSFSFPVLLQKAFCSGLLPSGMQFCLVWVMGTGGCCLHFHFRDEQLWEEHA
jgi:hypothetical protein